MSYCGHGWPTWENAILSAEKISNQERAQLITELRHELGIKLVVVLAAAKMSSSSYHDTLKCDYQRPADDLVEAIQQMRRSNPDYGYQTVTAELKNRHKVINHKVVLRIMKANNLLCHAFDCRITQYNSYRGTIGKITHNLVNRRFKADRPFQKVVTDITELR